MTAAGKNATANAIPTAEIAWLRDDGSAIDAARLPRHEQEELAGFRFEEKQRSFFFSRLLVRHLLRRHLPTIALDFKRAPDGRLLLAQPSPWHFSLSHSAGGVAAILCPVPCGIDIEISGQRNIGSLDKVAQRYFADTEKAALQNLPEDKRRLLFFRLWTLKEASVKALGEGLANNMSRLAFAISHDLPRQTGNAPALQLWQRHESPYWLAAAVRSKNPVQWKAQEILVGDL